MSGETESPHRVPTPVRRPRYPTDRETPTNSILGAFVREHRKKRGLSLSQLGEMVQLSRQAISQIEHGQNFLWRSDKVDALAVALDVEPAEIRSRRTAPPWRRPHKVKPRPTPVAQLISDKRYGANLTQLAMATRLGLSGQAYEYCERGLRPFPPETIARFKELFPLTTEELAKLRS